MIYYIVVNEWNYPTESGRDIIGDFDTIEEAEKVAYSQCSQEMENFAVVNHNEFYEQGSGKIVGEDGECRGYILNSSPHEELNMTFQSIIIKREL